MAVTAQLDDDQIEELAAILKNCDKLSAVLSKSAEIGPKVGTYPLSKALAKSIALDPNELVLVINGLVHAYFMRSEDGKSEDVVQSLANDLEKSKKPELLKA